METVTTGPDWTDTLLYFVPALLVLMGAFLFVKRFTDSQLAMMKRFLDRDMQVKVIEDRARRKAEALPIRLQAYERLILFMERISPESLLVRVQQSAVSSQVLHFDLLVNIRSEFEHNLSQQLYVSDEAWSAVCAAKDAVVEMVDSAYRNVGPTSAGVNLTADIFAREKSGGVSPTFAAIMFLKEEAKTLFS